nr:hypothetical protein HmN_000453500 [Hymenolepis microstoma]
MVVTFKCHLTTSVVQCQEVGEIADQPIVELAVNSRKPGKPSISSSDLEGGFASLMKNAEIYLNEAREYMRKIEEIADFVDSQICDPPKKKMRNALEAKGPIIDTGEEMESEESEEDDEEDSLIYHVKAIRDISSAYRDAWHEVKNALMNLMISKTPKKILDKRPLMVPKLISAKSIQGLRPQFINTILLSDKAENTEFDSNWMSVPITSSTVKRKLCCFVLLLLGLLFTM